MYKQRRKFNIFAEGSLRQYLTENNQKIRSQIGKELENYILNVNETEYVNYLLDKFTIDAPIIDFENAYVTDYEKRTSDRKFPKQVIVYHLPYTGNADLLQYTPSRYISWTIPVFIEDQSLCFEIVSIRKNAREINEETHSYIEDLKRQLEFSTKEIESYNAQLRTKIEMTFKARKQGILNNREILASLDVPIKKREDLPQTYAIPTPQTRKNITTKPNVTVSGYKPEPTLDQPAYHEILQTIHDVGKVFERLPSTYSGKSEENLRDHILLYLEPRFEGSATGETFNKSGRTDILIRYENSNVFIAECKFWRGQKGYLAAITQLLRNLTWRDSKAAVVVFVKNRNFSSVLRIVEEITPNHPNYLGFKDKEDESWFNYRFHIDGDPNREVKLAVLLFHIP